MTNTVIYARYSSSSQTEQSIEGQLRVCHEYAERNGLSVINEYIDRAITGTNDDRPSFLQMISDANKKQFQYILVYKLDRFSRNRYDSVFYKHKLQQCGVKVISAMEAISDTQEGKLVEGLLEMMAEMYSHDLSQKVKRGIRESRIKGIFTGGNVLFGYKVIDKKLVLDEEYAPIVRYVFEQYANGKGKKAIVDELNAKGLKTYAGKKFTINSFNTTMRNRKYIGENVIDGVVSGNSYPALLDIDLFNRVQAKLDERKHAPAAAKAKEDYILSGKAFCGHCGSRLVGICGTSETKDSHRYYVCSKQYKEHTCDKKYEKKKYLERYVVEETLRRVLTPECSDEIAELVLSEYEKNINAVKIKDYEKQLAKIEHEFDKCVELMLKAGCDEVVKRLDNKAKDLALQKSDLLKELSKLKLANKMQHTKKDILAWLNIFTRGDILSPEYQRRIIDVFISSVYLFDDKIVIYYNLDGGSQVSYLEMLQNIENFDNDDCRDVASDGKRVRISSALLRHMQVV
jgi:DNA invertase Pin-like site-specific DNA recombinase